MFSSTHIQTHAHAHAKLSFCKHYRELPVVSKMFISENKRHNWLFFLNTDRWKIDIGFRIMVVSDISK